MTEIDNFITETQEKLTERLFLLLPNRNSLLFFFFIAFNLVRANVSRVIRMRLSSKRDASPRDFTKMTNSSEERLLRHRVTQNYVREIQRGTQRARKTDEGWRIMNLELRGTVFSFYLR